MERVFGPVPSRRLGRSIGINNIPPKVCTYSCVYCQLGKAIEMAAQRRSFYEPDELIEETGRKVEQARSRGDQIDYLTIVPDGEPTLDGRLGELIVGLRSFGIKTALISNGSLLGDPQLREELLGLDWISVKVDSVDEAVWRKTDRPHKSLAFGRMLAGTLTLAESFEGTFTTETMLIRGLNDTPKQIDEVAEMLEALEPAKAYISIPTRPPAESWVEPADEERIAYADGRFRSVVPHVENLIGYEGNEFTASGDARDDLLSITAVHPMRRDAVEALLEKDGADASVLEELLRSGDLKEVAYSGYRYYVRGFRK